VLVKDVLDADVLEVIAWAEGEIADEGLFAVALVEESSSGERGLVWLVGMDANDDPHNEVERARRHAMESRRGRRTVRLPSSYRQVPPRTAAGVVGEVGAVRNPRD
jgi:hypothetical protein